MQTYLWPNLNELRQIDAAYMARLTQDDPIFSLFPIRQTNGHLVTWRQRDNYTGLQQPRVLDGEFPSVPLPGRTDFLKKPGIYGEHVPIPELDITARAANDSFGDRPIDISDLVMEAGELLLARQINRMSYVLWTLLASGVYTITDEVGTIVDREQYNLTTITASPTWDDLANSKPMADLRSVNLKATGTSSQFGASAIAFMNLQTFTWMDGNTNANDLGGKRDAYGASVIGLDGINQILFRDNLPKIVIWNEGYYTDGTSSTFKKFLADGDVVVVGSRRNSTQVGEFLLTRNANNPDVSSAPFYKVVDTGRDPNARPPRQVAVYRGHNGGPALYYPGSVVYLKAK